MINSIVEQSDVLTSLLLNIINLFYLNILNNPNIVNNF